MPTVDLEDALEKQLRVLGAAEAVMERSIKDQPLKIRTAYATGNPEAQRLENELPELRASFKKLQNQIRSLEGKLYTLRHSKKRDNEQEQSDT